MQEDWSARFERARQQHQAKKAQRGEKGLIRLEVSPTGLRLPATLFERMGGVATIEQATWYCSDCEETPTPRQYANGFVPGKCSCQVEREQRLRVEREQQERIQQQRKLARAQCEQCYTWLGPEWSSFGLERKTFEGFNVEVQSEALTAAIEYAMRLCGNIALWSDKSWGTGKTHLASAICNFQLARDIPCRFTTAQNLFNAFGARMDDHQGYSDLLSAATKTPLLVIDDLDKVHLTASGYKQGVFFEVFNQRYLRRLPTVITTNARVRVTHDDVEGLSEYIGRAAASRLCDVENGGLTVVEMNGEDYRRRDR